MRETKQVQLLTLAIFLLFLAACGGSQKSQLKGAGEVGTHTSELRGRPAMVLTPAQRLKVKYASIEFVCKAVAKVGNMTTVAEARTDLFSLEKLPRTKDASTTVKLIGKDGTDQFSIQFNVNLLSIAVLDEANGLIDVTEAKINGDYEFKVKAKIDSTSNSVITEKGLIEDNVVYDDDQGLKTVMTNTTNKYKVDITCGFEVVENI